jgi:hypothetical protein
MKTDILVIVFLWIYIPAFLATLKMIWETKSEINDRKVVNLLLMSIANSAMVIAIILLNQVKG